MKTSRLRKASPEHVPAGTTAAHDTTWRPLGTEMKAGGRACPAGQAGSARGLCGRASPSPAGMEGGGEGRPPAWHPPGPRGPRPSGARGAERSSVFKAGRTPGGRYEVPRPSPRDQGSLGSQRG